MKSISKHPVLSKIILGAWLIVYPCVCLLANPVGENVVADSATFERSGNTLQITTSDRVIVN